MLELSAGQEIVMMISQLEAATVESGSPPPRAATRHPLRVSNSNTRGPRARPPTGQNKVRKRASSVLTEVQGRLLIRAGAAKVPCLDENMIPPGVRSPGSLQGTGNSQNQPPLGEKYRLRQGPRPKVRH